MYVIMVPKTFVLYFISFFLFETVLLIDLGQAQAILLAQPSLRVLG